MLTASRGETFFELVMFNWHWTWGCLITVLPVVWASHCTTMSMFAPWKLSETSSWLVPAGATSGSDGTQGPPPLFPESDFEESPPLGGGVGMEGTPTGTPLMIRT